MPNINSLDRNQGIGTICELEADFLDDNQEQDWRSNSANLRAAYHHETIGHRRKQEDVNIIIENPSLSSTSTSPSAFSLSLLTRAFFIS